MKSILVIIASALLPVASWASADDAISPGEFRAAMTGYEEVLPVMTQASGEAVVSVSYRAAAITIALKYSGLSSAPTVTQLHWGQQGVSGPAILTICGGASGNVCPTNGAAAATFTFTAQALQTITSATASLTGSFPAADLTAFADAVRNGVVYVNVRSQSLPNGEIRGQLGRGSGSLPGGNPGQRHRTGEQ